jgi:hypothetical protein
MGRNETLDRNGKGSNEAVYHQPMPVSTRVILVIGAGITLLAPYELLIKPGVPVFRLGMVPFWVVAGGASLIGVLLLAAAVFGFTKTVRFDFASRRMILRADGIFRISRIWSHPFDRLGMPVVRADSNTEGPPAYRLEIPIDGRRRPFEIATFQTEELAMAEADRLRMLLDA